MRLDAYSIKSPSYFLGAVICATTVLVTGSLRAQNAGQAQDRAQLLRAQPNPTYGPETSAEDQGYAVASPNDKDLGEQQILKRQAEYKPFTFSFAVPFFLYVQRSAHIQGCRGRCAARAGARLQLSTAHHWNPLCRFPSWTNFSSTIDSRISISRVSTRSQASLIICRNFTTSPCARVTTSID